jgi:large subunit ribosomal protein L24
MNVKRGDTVVVLSGKDRGKKGRILSAHPKDNTVVVENVNVATKHKKAKTAQEQGGRVKVNLPLDASNVLIICPKCNKATRVSKQLDETKGVYFRVCKKCGASLDSAKFERRVRQVEEKEVKKTKKEKAKEKTAAPKEVKRNEKVKTSKGNEPVPKNNKNTKQPQKGRQTQGDK